MTDHLPRGPVHSWESHAVRTCARRVACGVLLAWVLPALAARKTDILTLGDGVTSLGYLV
jgi:hypothetical protein